MDITIVRSRRKTLSIEVNSEAKVIVRAPIRMSDAVINKFLDEKSEWINSCVQKAQENKKRRKKIEKLSEKDMEKLFTQAKHIIPQKCKYYADLIGVNYGRITIRNQKSRWGSCSVKGNLNFNCLLMLTPEEVQDYVVIHELCHRKEMNHSVRFWNEVEKIMPDYRIKRKWLKENGTDIIERMLK